jgi:hypothetical protein
MLGQYAVSVLEGPRLQQVLSHSAQTIGRADQVSMHRAAPADGLSWWGGVRGDLQRYDHADLYDGLAPAGLFGIDWARDGMVSAASPASAASTPTSATAVATSPRRTPPPVCSPAGRTHLGERPGQLHLAVL